MITTTSTILLDGLRDPSNQSIWREFDERYRSVIEAFARKLGLSPDDAADAAQETLAEFVRDYRAGKFDRSRGRLRSWIFGIARHRIADQQRAKARRREWRGESAIADMPADDQLAQIWEGEARAAMLRQAMRELYANPKLDPRTIRAFEQVAFEQKTAAEVAGEVGMSVEQVYVAKSRTLRRLLGIMTELEEIW
jgi:RNA polymerase sigma-70 factor (ECF subfamily)